MKGTSCRVFSQWLAGQSGLGSKAECFTQKPEKVAPEKQRFLRIVSMDTPSWSINGGEDEELRALQAAKLQQLFYVMPLPSLPLRREDKVGNI